MKRKVVCLRTKTKYVKKPTELRDYKEYWIKRLIRGNPTHFYKHNQHGVVSPLFRIVLMCIVNSPEKYLKEGVLHTKKAIMIFGVSIDEGDAKEKDLAHKKHLWNLWSLSNGEIGEEPPEEVLNEWR